MKTFETFVGTSKPYDKPFTLVDPSKFTWTVATDKYCLFAVKGLNKGPRFRGEMSQLSALLKLLKVSPRNPIKFDRSRVKYPQEPLANILGVTVSMESLKKVLQELPEGLISMWNATEYLGASSLALVCQDSLSIIMGHEGDLANIPDCIIEEGSALDEFAED